jgi:hypothetical protein
VTVRAEQAEVVKPVVAAAAVHMVQRHGQRLPPPVRDPTFLAAVVLHPSAEQPGLEMGTVGWSVVHEVHLERCGSRSRNDRAALHRIGERLTAETEALLALTDRIARVVVALDLRPVKAAVAALVYGFTETTAVITDR